MHDHITRYFLVCCRIGLIIRVQLRPQRKVRLVSWAAFALGLAVVTGLWRVYAGVGTYARRVSQ